MHMRVLVGSFGRSLGFFRYELRFQSSVRHFRSRASVALEAQVRLFQWLFVICDLIYVVFNVRSVAVGGF